MASSYLITKHDIGITNTDGTIIGFMLQQKNGIPAYAEFDDEYLASQFFTDVPGYASLPAEKELAIRQDSWRSGFGLDQYDKDDGERYFTARGMDMRFRNMAFPGNKPVSVTKPPVAATSAVLTNVGFEAVGTQPWKLAYTGVQNSVAPHTGSYSWSPAGELANTLGGWDNSWRGRRFAFGAWCLNNDTGIGDGNIQIGMYDGVGGHPANIGKVTRPAGTWLYYHLNFIVDAAATSLTVNASTGGAAAGHIDDCTIGSPVASTVDAIAEYNNNLYLGFGTQLAKLNADGAGFEGILTLPEKITDLEPFPDDRLYIGQGLNTAPYFSINTAEGLAAHGAGSNLVYKYFKTVLQANPTLWGSQNNYQLRSNTGPANVETSSWSGVTNVGASYNELTGLKTKSGALYIMKSDMPYYLNSAGVVQNDLAPELAYLTKNGFNGKQTIIWLNKLYIPWAEQALLENDSGTNTWRNPSLYCKNIPKYNGRVAGLAADDQWLFAGLNDTGCVQILAGRIEDLGTAKWVWHPICEVPITNCGRMVVSSVYQKRLWVFSNDPADNWYYIPLPTGYGDIVNDVNRNIPTNVDFETPWLHANFKDTTKAFPSIVTTLGHAFTNTDMYYSLYYKTIDNTAYSFIGNAAGSAASMTNTFYLPLTPKSTMTRLKFVANTSANTAIPILSGYNLKGLLYPERRKIIATTIKVADVTTLKDGTIDKAQPTMVTAMNELRAAQWPVTIYDLDGNTVTVKPIPLSASVPWRVPLKTEKGRVIEWQYNLLLQKVTTA